MSPDLEAIAAALRALPGVTNAVVHPDDAGGVDSLRLDLSPGADGLEVAGAASRLVRERFGTDVDATSVHVVDAPETTLGGAAPRVPSQRATRPEIVRTDLVTAGHDFSATVVLSSRSRAATGDAHGTITPQGMQRAVGQATLRAIERLVRDNARLELDTVVVTQAGDQRTALVTLTMLSSHGTERLTGSAVVREDESRAVVRATLDALNRRLEALLG